MKGSLCAITLVISATFLDGGQRLMYISYIRHPKAPATSVDHPSHHEIPKKATWCRATERLRRCKCWQCWESCKHRRETSGSASQQQHQFCSHSMSVCMYFILVYLYIYMLDCAMQCATHNSLTWSNPNVWQCDVIPIRPFLDNHDGTSLCSPICVSWLSGRVIRQLVPGQVHVLFKQNSQNLSEATVRRSDYVFS